MAPHLPGFYFDEEKKKYFKIQPNHIAPSNAKYALSNFKHEQRLAKKQKVENDRNIILQSQTVLPAPILKHSLLANGLDREFGFQPLPVSLLHREDAFLRGLHLNDDNRLFSHAVLDAHWLPESITVVSSTGLYSISRLNNCGSHLTLPNSRILSTCMFTASETAYVLGCTDGQGSNAFCMPIDNSQHTALNWHVNDNLIDCAANGSTLAFAGESSISTFTTSGQKISLLHLPARTSSSSVEWLSVHTLAYAACESKGKKKPSNHTVMLWDIRSPTATAARFTRQKRITGLSKPDSSGNNLIVTSNYDISLYDLRLLKADRPMLSISHLSEGPVTHHATSNGSMLAVIDHRQEIQTYSWRTGKHVKTVLSRSQDGWRVLRNLKWYEGLNGPFLQVCGGNTVLSIEM